MLVHKYSSQNLEILMNVNITWNEKYSIGTNLSAQTTVDPFAMIELFILNSSSLLTAANIPSGLRSYVDSSRMIITGNKSHRN